ncbi:hypothetical protein CI109_106790 [Kwoniella shandongensis]|uniref:Erythromycin biosynthesis protein CIII-like C-terminal domain-containing protein n=1 Tax=Kwoniella shandongensis TaxID=1734106 RepID=A0AAJ8LT25_9TREE
MSKPKVLFLTSPELGQSSVHLNVIDWLKREHQDDLEIHLGSYESLRSRTKEGVTFHSIVDPISKRDNQHDPRFNHNFTSVSKSPGFIGACQALMGLFSIMHPEAPGDYLETAKSVKGLLADLSPALVVVDPCFESARDALTATGRPHIILSPNTIKEIGQAAQGAGAFSWPAVATGYPIVMPWYLYPASIFVTIFPLIWLNLFDKPYKAFIKARSGAGYTGPMPFLVDSTADRFTKKVLCMSTAEAEIPAIYPDTVVCCGPILPIYRTFKAVDPQLFDQLKSAGATHESVVLISLGSHHRTTKQFAQNMLTAIRVLLDKRKDVQVLWRLKRWGGYDLEGVDEVKDRLIVVDWLEAEPVSILASGLVGCYVHHGGSNSYHEALALGIPQVLLPAWFDCFDFANRVEYFGIGLWGNRQSAPNCTYSELCAALLTVMGTGEDVERAVEVRERAKRLAVIVTKDHTTSGGQVAATCIWDELQRAAS